MAGLIALVYGLTKGTASIVESIRNDKYEKIITDSAIKNGALTYSLNGQLYWTANNQPCHIYTDSNGVKQIRSGTIYGGGIVLLENINKKNMNKQKKNIGLRIKDIIVV